MPEPTCCAEVRWRLARYGIGPERIDRVVSELSEHWEDLRVAAIENGLGPSAAAAEANTRLGDPAWLADESIRGFRQSSRLGRHPVLALCVLPFLLSPLLMSVVVMPLWWLDSFIHFTHWGSTDDRRNARLIVAGMWVAHYAAMVFAPAFLGSVVWRAGLGIRWVCAMCAWCAFAALARVFEADAIDRKISMAFSFPWRLNAHTAAILFLHGLILAFFWAASRKATKKTIHPLGADLLHEYEK